MATETELADKVLVATEHGTYLPVAALTALQGSHGSGVTGHLLDRDIIRAALQPDLHPAIAGYLRQHPLPQVAAAAQLVAASTEELGKFFDDEHPLLLPPILPHPVEIYAATHDSPVVRERLAKYCVGLSEEASALLAQDESVSVRRYTALRCRLTITSAETLAQDESTVRVLLAQNPHLAFEQRLELIESLDARRLAGCRYVPAHVVQRLVVEAGLGAAVDSAADWQSFVETFHTLEDWQEYVGSFTPLDPLNFMIRNWSLPPAVQAKLVVRAAEAYQRHREEPAHHWAHALAYELSRQPRLCTDEMRTLLDAGLGVGLATNVSLPVALQERIAAGSESHAHSDLEIRQAIIQLASNTSLDPSIRSELLRSRNRGVASRAIRNLKLTGQDLAAVVDRLDDDVAIAVAFAAHPALPVEIMGLLAQHEHPKVREILARNYSAPMELRDRLAHDPEERVRYWAMSPRAIVKPLSELQPPLARVAIDWV